MIVLQIFVPKVLRFDDFHEIIAPFEQNFAHSDISHD